MTTLDDKKMPPSEKPHMTTATWQEFLDTGMLWYVNRLLHVFGWSIVFEVDDDDVITRVWPSRTTWKGFPEAMEREGYAKVEAHLRDLFRNAD